MDDLSDTDSLSHNYPARSQDRLNTAKEWVKSRPKAFYAIVLAFAAVIFCVGFLFVIFMIILLATRGGRDGPPGPGPGPKPDPHHKIDESKFFGKMNQLTDRGTAAEAYWSPDGKELVMQAQLSREDGCDEIYTMNADGTNLFHVDNYEGITTCAYFVPSNDNYIIYSSTLDKYGKGCPPKPDRNLGYVWPLYNQQVYVVDRYTRKIVHTLTKHEEERCKEQSTQNCYNAEATISRDGETMIFTSTRSGDLELYAMNISSRASDGHARRLTYSPGYDGGAWFSNKGDKIVWRAYRPTSTEDLQRYKMMLDFGIIEGINKLEVYVMNADGTNQQQLTNFGTTAFAPNWLPDDSGIIFSSNHENPREFHLYVMDLQGKNVKRITSEGSFNGFPMFSPDGKKLAFSSNRGAKSPHEMYLFVVDWKGFSYNK